MIQEWTFADMKEGERLAEEIKNLLPSKLPEERREEAFLIIAHAMLNSLEYAGVGSAALRWTETAKGEILITVLDQGVGFLTSLSPFYQVGNEDAAIRFAMRPWTTGNTGNRDRGLGLYGCLYKLRDDWLLYIQSDGAARRFRPKRSWPVKPHYEPYFTAVELVIPA